MGSRPRQAKVVMMLLYLFISSFFKKRWTHSLRHNYITVREKKTKTVSASREGSIKREEIYEMMGKEKEEMIGSVDFFPVFFLSRSTIDAAWSAMDDLQNGPASNSLFIFRNIQLF